MSKIHVLPDEKLNGVLREYIEVERKAYAGEKIIGKNTGNIYTVLNVFSSLIETDTRQRIHHRDYFVLEPTDTIRIDGKRYRMVDRKPSVGEKIIAIDYDIVSDLIVKPGDVLTVKKVNSGGVDCVGGAYFSHGDKFKDEYCVLEPLPETTETSKSIVDLIANLAQRVTELERQQKENRELITMMLDDIVTLDERTQPLVALIKAVKDDG